ncbi:Gmad2 immunoglobulin-like domain-containing protein [Cellulomonas soli]|uniref:Gmad2 immunoglobulin-like domain-containing protein n=1 Tax=Cellulomonas soli TaxID=931535 RepID=UPI003F87B1A9
MAAARVGARLVTGVVLLGLLTSCADAGTGTSSTASPTGEPTAGATPTASSSPSSSAADDASPAPGADVATAGTTVLLTPTSGAVLDGPTVTVSGEGTAFEGTLLWDVVPAGSGDDAVGVAEGFTQAGANGEVGPFTFTVDLEPGDWTIRVWEPDMSDGEGAEAGADRRHLVTVTVAVR